MRRLWPLTLGIVLLLGSCVPTGLAIKQRLQEREIANVPLAVSQTARSPWLTPAPEGDVVASLEVELDTHSVQEESTAADEVTYKARYRIPYRYRILEDPSGEVDRGKGDIDWRAGSKTVTRRGSLSPQGGRLTVSQTIARLTPTGSETLAFEATLSPDDLYRSEVRNARLIVRDRVARYAPFILTSIGLFLLGCVVSLVGVLVLAGQGIADAQGAAPSSEAQARHRQWAMWIHLSSFAGLIVPLGNVIAPLALWLSARTRDPFIDAHGRACLNFRLSMLIYYLVALLLAFLLVGLLLAPLLFLFDVALTITAAVNASNGKPYRYPFTLRFIAERAAAASGEMGQASS